MGRKVIGVILTVIGCLGFVAGLPMLFRGIFMFLTPESAPGSLDGDVERYVATRELFGGLVACVVFGIPLIVGIWLLRKGRRPTPPLIRNAQDQR
jgi:hypothetical protein